MECCLICGVDQTATPTTISGETLGYLCDKLKLSYPLGCQTPNLCAQCAHLWEDLCPLYSHMQGLISLVDKKVEQFRERNDIRKQNDQLRKKLKESESTLRDFVRVKILKEEPIEIVGTDEETDETFAQVKSDDNACCIIDGSESEGDDGDQDTSPDFFQSILSPTENEISSPSPSPIEQSKEQEQKANDSIRRTKRKVNNSDARGCLAPSNKRQRREDFKLPVGETFPSIHVAQAFISLTKGWSPNKGWTDAEGKKFDYCCKYYWCGACLQIVAPVNSKKCHLEHIGTDHDHSANVKRPTYGIPSVIKEQIIKLVEQGIKEHKVIIEILSNTGYQPPPQTILVSYLGILWKQTWGKEKESRRKLSKSTLPAV
ncbi:hypothetical protein Fcan01_04779 [Folsomia candida]|uniref:Uncharacterized protein n=1 Tax=Folsomia candida TaxID=158441 RepID=A0A226EUV6_FOLCA|nr:hypothetical protein Fcan01_04779 [Folsomia candida]